MNMTFKTKAGLSGTAIAVLLTVTAFVGLSSATATAFVGGSPPDVTLNGGWAPFNRCPVDDPRMLSADGATNIALCMSVSSPGGSVTIGKVTLPIGGSNFQAGGIANNEAEGAVTLVSPRGGAAVGSPLQLPGGLQALVCPSSSPGLRAFCRARPYGFLNSIVMTMVSAGEPSNFNLAAGAGTGAPILTLPLKVHLENPLLGGHCYIGTDSEPIVLHAANLSPPTLGFENFAGDGTRGNGGPLTALLLNGAAQSDTQVAIPGVHGCGVGGLLDKLIDGHIGLPSPSGDNAIVSYEVSSEITLLNEPEAIVPNDGKILSGDWHSAVLRGHGHH